MISSQLAMDFLKLIKLIQEGTKIRSAKSVNGK